MLKKIKTAIPLLFNDFAKIKKREKKILKTWHELNLTQEPLKSSADEVEDGDGEPKRPKRWIPIFCYIPSQAVMQRMILRAANLPPNFKGFDSEL